jgi:hypothetical protein
MDGKQKSPLPPSVKTLGDLDEILWMMKTIIIIIPSQQYPWHFMDDDTLQQNLDWNTGWMDGWMDG